MMIFGVASSWFLKENVSHLDFCGCRLRHIVLGNVELTNLVFIDNDDGSDLGFCV